MKIALITDAWQPQVNGVVRTWQQVIALTQPMGYQWNVIHPGLFRNMPAPRYPEIRLALMPGRKMARLLDETQPQAIHIATEGPLGLAGRRYCIRRRLPFTSSYHTQYPLYLRRYYGIPERYTYRFMRWFHAPARATLVPTPSLCRELEHHGFRNLVTWTRGVDCELFHPIADAQIPNLNFRGQGRCASGGRGRPIFLYAGRIAAEKNIEAFLTLDLPGSKVIVGDGPHRRTLENRFPQAYFVGYKFGRELVEHYAAADVFVFPSRTDTFGIVLLEANACGLPVAAFPVTGPIDVVAPGRSGCLNHDLRAACLGALRLDRRAAVEHARQFTWQRCVQIALDHIALLPGSTSTGSATQPRSVRAPLHLEPTVAAARACDELCGGV
ncbi:MAG: glycosyltransferase family 1 protein [Phycisphaeraceae bacterium]|nr:glycosyltransferase family 1 protein [Phycisphaeraceae bacterium]